MGVNVEIVRACLASAPALRREVCGQVAEEMGLSEGDVVAAHVGPSLPLAMGAPMEAVRLDVQDWAGLRQGLVADAEWLDLVCGGSRLRLPGEGGAARPPGRVEPAWAGMDAPARVFAVTWHGQGGARRSVEGFDGHGRLVLHGHWTSDDGVRWNRFLNRWGHRDQGPGMTPAPAPVVRAVARSGAPSPEHVQAWRQGWCEQRRVEDHEALRRHWGLCCEQALEWADARFVRVFEVQALSDALHESVALGLALSVCLGEGGAAATLTSTWRSVRVLREAGLGARVTLEGEDGTCWTYREAAVARAWCVSRPTALGLRQSVELFDAEGRRLATVVAARRPGHGESCLWRSVLQRTVAVAELDAEEVRHV